MTHHGFIACQQILKFSMNQWKWPNDFESGKSTLGHLLKENVIFYILIFLIFLTNKHLFFQFIFCTILRRVFSNDASQAWLWAYKITAFHHWPMKGWLHSINLKSCLSFFPIFQYTVQNQLDFFLTKHLDII